MANKESRRVPRAAHDSVLELRDEDGVFRGDTVRLVDVSRLGARFSTTRTFRKGARVRGRLRLFGVGVFDVSGRVVRLKEKENFNLYGVEFETCTPAAAPV